MDKVGLYFGCILCRFGKGSFAEPTFLLEIYSVLVTLMISSPEVKDPIILDSGKKVTQYQRIPFSHSLKQNLFCFSSYR